MSLITEVAVAPTRPPSPIPTADPAASANGRLTYVELVWIERRVERWIRFGRSCDERILDRHTRFLGFAPGQVFAFVRWACNDHGTVVSRIDILRAVGLGEAYSTVSGVLPGGELLLRLNGWPIVEQVLRAIDAIEALDIAPADACPDYWRHAHNRLAVGEPPRAYTRARHDAWLQRRALGR